jgi:hypothetical protein
MKKILDYRELISAGIAILLLTGIIIHNCLVYGMHNSIASF